MSYIVSFEVEEEDLARQIVEDTQKSDSMYLQLVDGDELEFGVKNIKYEDANPQDLCQHHREGVPGSLEDFLRQFSRGDSRRGRK